MKNMGLYTCSRMTLAADELPLLSRNSTMDGDANSLEEENEGPASLVKILFPQKKPERKKLKCIYYAY